MRKKKKSIARILLIIIVMLVAAFIFRGGIYRGLVSYKEDGGRKNYKAKDKNLVIFIEDRIDKSATDIESIVDLSQKITNDALSFSSEIKENDPNKTVLLKRANSSGYAAFTASVGNYLIDKNNLSKVWEAKPVKGKLYVLGNDMNKKTKNKSFKEYDFVIFRNKITKKEITVDPTAYDKYGIMRITKE